MKRWESELVWSLRVVNTAAAVVCLAHGELCGAACATFMAIVYWGIRA